jgi:hypothetical protein
VRESGEYEWRARRGGNAYGALAAAALGFDVVVAARLVLGDFGRCGRVWGRRVFVGVDRLRFVDMRRILHSVGALPLSCDGELSVTT